MEIKLMHNKKFLITVSSYDANPIILSFLYRISAAESKTWTVIIGP